MTIEELNEKTLIELKALVYDAMVTVENAQQNIKVLNQIIANKLTEEPKDS